MEKYTNDLIRESSPYLLQHAHNPVNWVAWSEDVFERAKRENKLVLISVGYSSCHWCHVMEHESFEDEEVAALMNKFFINVKVDREERPDVDQVYMTAVQLMTQQGGWPLNCFTMPDGSPVYGGTYFQKENWMHILRSLQHAFENEEEKLVEYGENLKKGVAASELITQKQSNFIFEEKKLQELMLRWSKNFDRQQGGNSRAPKFPLPSNFEFLLDYALNEGDETVESYVELSLDKMAMGGIYDQVGGGFSRYSVDMLWKVPHFEKMLYDNGQLLSLYAQGYRNFKKPMYKKVIEQTVEWMEREMLDESGAFYAALDADSEGVEGKFYVWKTQELEEVLGKDYKWVKDYYSLNQRGYWEDGNYILLRVESDKAFAEKMNWEQEELSLKVDKVNDLLLSARSGRVRPGLDDKCLTSWNAMALKGLCDAYVAFENDHFKLLALRNAKWLLEHQMKEDGSLWRSYKKGVSSIDGFLEDYSHVIAAFIALYEMTFDEDWLHRSKQLVTYVEKHFYDANSGMFFFTAQDTELIARKMEINDNVIPSSNSVMARNLFYLGKYFHDPSYINMAKQMLANVYDGMEMYGSGYSNWGMLLNHFVYGFYEFVILGDDQQVTSDVRSLRSPKVLVARSTGDSTLPIFEHKERQEETMIHVCTEGTCFLPTSDVTEALKQVIQ